MNDAELQEAFPFGALLIPADGKPSLKVKLGAGDEEEPEYFMVWRDAYSNQYFSRKLTPFEDGFKGVSASGTKYFLRPLPEADKADF